MTKQQVMLEIMEMLWHQYGVNFCPEERPIFACKILNLLEFLEQEAEQRQSVYRFVYTTTLN